MYRVLIASAFSILCLLSCFIQPLVLLKTPDKKIHERLDPTLYKKLNRGPTNKILQKTNHLIKLSRIPSERLRVRYITQETKDAEER